MRRVWMVVLGWLWIAPLLAQVPALSLAEVYRGGVPLERYWVSEKYDGVRAYWDGRRLWSRAGSLISAPAAFTANWPKQPMDGELWIGRGAFERLSGAVRAATPDQQAWRNIHYMVFDLPAEPGPFDHRLQVLRERLASPTNPALRAVPQFRVADADALQRRLDAVVAAGGEGLMLHRDDAPYRAGRSPDLLKLKPYDDAEAELVGYVPGKGKYLGMVGSLRLRDGEGREFRVGSGLTDALRRQPPPLGSQITYRFQGRTAEGKPRFARFLRVRSEPP